MTLLFLHLFTPPLETALWFTRILHPWTYLTLQIAKTSFWTIYLVLAIATMVTKSVLRYEELWALWRIWLIVGIALNLACCLGALAYGAWVVRRWRRLERTYDRLVEQGLEGGERGIGVSQASGSSEALVP